MQQADRGGRELKLPVVFWCYCSSWLHAQKQMLKTSPISHFSNIFAVNFHCQKAVVSILLM